MHIKKYKESTYKLRNIIQMEIVPGCKWTKGLVTQRDNSFLSPPVHSKCSINAYIGSLDIVSDVQHKKDSELSCTRMCMS